MRVEKFKRETNESLVIISCTLPHHKVALALDTGASHTTIDLTALLISGIELNQSVRIEKIETASGIIDAYVFRIASLTALGVTRTNIEVCAFDFFAYGVLTEFDGVLGIDFLLDYKICIDFLKSEITIG